MKILWLSWKDIQHPQAGGAEVVSSELLKGLVADGHEVILLTSNYKNAQPESVIDGYKVIRVGGRVSVYWQAYRYIKRNLSDWPEFIVEEINTMPYCSRLYLKSTPRILFFHMLCREIWFYQLPFPASIVGYLLEPLYLRYLSRDRAIAMSKSTKKDLIKYGFNPRKVSIISEGIQIKPVEKTTTEHKFTVPTIVSLGSLRAMKRTMDQIHAFEIAKAKIPSLQLKMAGDGSGTYGKRVLAAIETSRFSKDIQYLGRISAVEKIELLQKAHLITVTSIKEGWGLIVTEAASQGTPAIVYDVDGLRDSVKQGLTGAICHTNNPTELARNIVSVLSDGPRYKLLQHNAWQWSKDITFENSYQQFSKELSI